MTRRSGLFLARPALVQAAIGQIYFGGRTRARPCMAASADRRLREPTMRPALRRIRSIVESGVPGQSPWDRKQPESHAAAEEIYGFTCLARPPLRYHKRFWPASSTWAAFDEYSRDGKTLICGYERIGGFAVGSSPTEAARQQTGP